MTLPDFLVIGAQRAGTSLLHRILASHPEIYVPAARKEVHFFDRYAERGRDWYQRHFPDAAAAARYRAIGEATPDYLADPDVPARVHALLPEVRLIAILRDPVERAFSWYGYRRRSDHEQRPFADFLDQQPEVLAAGCYHRHLQRYLTLFPRPALHVMIYEELVGEPARELDALAAFLGLTRSWEAPTALLTQRVNTSAQPRFGRSFAAARRLGGWLMRHDINAPSRLVKRLGLRRLFGKRSAGQAALDPVLRQRLQAGYRDDIAALENLLGRDLTCWPSRRA